MLIVVNSTGNAVAQGETSLDTLIKQVLGDAFAEQNYSLALCEAEAEVDYFRAAGCPGYLEAVYNGNVAALRRSQAQFVMHIEATVTPLYADMGLFMIGADAVFALPPRLPYKLKRLRMRTPELIGLQISDGAQMIDKVVAPFQENAQRGVVENLRDGMRRLGLDPLPSQILPMLGAHDSKLLMSWASADPEGLADFLLRVEFVVDQL